MLQEKTFEEVPKKLQKKFYKKNVSKKILQKNSSKVEVLVKVAFFQNGQTQYNNFFVNRLKHQK